MYKQINLQLANGEKKDFGFLACGTTGIRYKMLFKEELFESILSIFNSIGADVIKKIMNEQENDEEEGIDLTNADSEILQAIISIASSGKLGTISKLAYVMNKQAEGADMNKLSIDGYLDWLEQFETLELTTHALDIVNIYMANREGTSTLKKNPGQQTET